MARKTKQREKLLTDIIKSMTSHELFSDNVARKDSEATIQKTLFLRLEKGNELKKILLDNGITDDTKAQEIALHKFSYEQDKNTTVRQFHIFNTSHRPDAVLEVNGIRIAIEIKKGSNGSAIRSGLGQAVLYSYQYDFTIYFFVDTTDGGNIKSSVLGEKESRIIEEMWLNYNTKFVVV